MVFTQSQLKDIHDVAIKVISSDTDLLEHIADKISEIVMKKMENRLEKLINKLEISEQKVTELQNDILKLREEKEELRDANDGLEQYTRRNSVRIFGIKEGGSEDIYREVYIVYRCDRSQVLSGKQGGGVLIAVHKKHKSEAINVNILLESLFVKIHMYGKDIIINSVYFPPHTIAATYEEYFNTLENTELFLTNDVIILGDFNISNINNATYDLASEEHRRGNVCIDEFEEKILMPHLVTGTFDIEKDGEDAVTRDATENVEIVLDEILDNDRRVVEVTKGKWLQSSGFTLKAGSSKNRVSSESRRIESVPNRIPNEPDIRRLMKDQAFENALSDLELVAWDCESGH
ncbi:hypothetical protein ILUMI_27527 [Ignelater luminosus]|uniref:Endonuclease/exonuclease/phosphatase domain-containing protein n=1 Tax=Ignelater luminosus TaxID=2038154 RepID=A0A8K0C5Z8_IGNLU|nr:hypothetical protein ILUMI_27527 [Ignelater luminosus]